MNYREKKKTKSCVVKYIREKLTSPEILTVRQRFVKKINTTKLGEGAQAKDLNCFNGATIEA